jgi:hypothetical protein
MDKAWRPQRRFLWRSPPESHCSRVSSLLQVVGTGWGGPCSLCQPQQGPGRRHGAQPQRSPSCFSTCAPSPGKGSDTLTTRPYFNALSMEPGQALHGEAPGPSTQVCTRSQSLAQARCWRRQTVSSSPLRPLHSDFTAGSLGRRACLL